MMPAGKLNKRLMIESPDTDQNEYGERVGTFSEVATVWACIEPVSPREVPVAQGFAQTVSHKVTMRYRSFINTTHRLRMGSRVLEINGILNPAEANEDTVCFVTEVK